MVEVDGLDTWKGGGMRMFSNLNIRFAGFYCSYADSTYFVNTSGLLSDDRVKTLPVEKQFRALGAQIRKNKWCVVQKEDGRTEITLCKDGGASVELIVDSLAVFQLRYDKSTKIIKPILIKSYAF